MGTDIKELIQAKWRAEERPFFDGVLFENGDIVLCECNVVVGADSSSSSATVRPLARSTLASFLDYGRGENRWVFITGTGSFKTGRATIAYGEGSYGGDGFVALCDEHGDHLRWMAACHNSNPFKSAELVDGEVVAVSTNGHRWVFPLDRPDLVRIAP